MKLRSVASATVSGVVVYVAVAACSAVANSGAPTGADRDGAPPSTSNGSSGSVTDPVPSAMADPWTVNGTRLKARVYEAEDGAKQFLGWRDTQRGENCSFNAHEEGGIRCLPMGAFVSTYGVDESCTHRLAYRNKTVDAPPKTVVESTPTGLRVFASDGPFAGQSIYQCGAGGYRVPDPTLDYFIVGAKIGGEAFVSATERVSE